MKSGLLWFDDDPGRELKKKVARAAYRYHQKFGIAADTCYVHLDAADDVAQVGHIRVFPIQSIPQHHLWIGKGNGNE